MNSGFKDIFIGYGHLNFGSAYKMIERGFFVSSTRGHVVELNENRIRENSYKKKSEIYIFWDFDQNVIKLGGVSKYLNVNVSLNWFKFERERDLCVNRVV